MKKLYLKFLPLILLLIISLSPYYGFLITDKYRRQLYNSSGYSYDLLVLGAAFLVYAYLGFDRLERPYIRKVILGFSLFLFFLTLLEVFSIVRGLLLQEEVLSGWVNGLVIFSILSFISLKSYQVTVSTDNVKKFLIFSLLTFLTVFIPLWFPSISLASKFVLRSSSYLYLLLVFR